jgi:hypothetical protein
MMRLLALNSISGFPMFEWAAAHLNAARPDMVDRQISRTANDLRRERT